VKYDRETVKAWAGNSQWRALRADLARFRSQGYSGWASEGFWALALYRMQKIVLGYRSQWILAPVRFVLIVARKLFTLVAHIDIDPAAEIGPGLLIPHVGTIRVHGATKIGADCSLYHGCTIGAGPRPGGAIIGDHVFISCNSSIIGAVKIGDGAVIAANTLVIDDVPPNATAIGVPARVLPAADGITTKLRGRV
jgi:serine O-acetyltransferase